MMARKGFTVLELIVAIGVFLIVVTIAVGGLVRSLRTIHQITELISANGNASLTIEQMAREIRTGYEFSAGECNPDCGELIFKNTKQDTIIYRKNGTVIERECIAGTGPESGCGNDAASYAISANNVNVKHLSFLIFGVAPGDGYQPRITITLGIGGKGTGTADIAVNLQTTISPRFPLDS